MKEKNMKTRKEIHLEYKERVKPSGVFEIKNIANGKVLLGSSLNLEGPLNKHRFMLGSMGIPIQNFKKTGTSWAPINSSLKSWKLFR